MNKGIIGGLSVVLVAIVGYTVYFAWATSRSESFTSIDENDHGLTWLKSEFGLGDSEFSTVKQVNAQYTPRCEAMCMELASARQSLAAMIIDPAAVAEEIEVAYGNVNEIEQKCFRMTLEHIYEVSMLMKPEQGVRYRMQMVAQLVGYQSEHHKLHSNIVRSNPSIHLTE